MYTLDLHHSWHNGAGRRVRHRTAVRAIAQEGSKFLTIYTPLENVYEFPGGGLKESETHEQALRREVMEETGHELTFFGRLFALVIDHQKDMHHQGQNFVMHNYYYLCSARHVTDQLVLEPYELRLQIEPRWVELATIRDASRNLLESRASLVPGTEEADESEPQIKPWIMRGARLFDLLLEHQKNLLV